MNFRIEASQKFARDLKRLVKKFPSLKKEFTDLVYSLSINPFQGIPLAHHCYKIRLSISSKGKGKSGGARIITHVFVAQKVVYLITIYDKSEATNVSEKEILLILKSLGLV